MNITYPPFGQVTPRTIVVIKNPTKHKTAKESTNKFQWQHPSFFAPSPSFASPPPLITKYPCPIHSCAIFKLVQYISNVRNILFKVGYFYVLGQSFSKERLQKQKKSQLLFPYTFLRIQSIFRKVTFRCLPETKGCWLLLKEIDGKNKENLVRKKLN